MILRLVILFILLALPAYAGFVPFPGNAMSSLYCGACPDTGKEGDTLCEVPDGTADGMCGWTATTSGEGSATAVLDYACDESETLSCKGISPSYCMRTTQTDCDSQDDTYIWKQFASSDYEGHMYVQFYVKILTTPTKASGGTCVAMTNGLDIEIVGFTPGSMPSSYPGNVYISIYKDTNTAGDWHLGLHYHACSDSGCTSSAWYGPTSDSNLKSTAQVTTDGSDWLGVRLHVYNGSGNGVDYAEWWIDYSNDGTWTAQTGTGVLTYRFDREFKYIVMGQNELDRQFDIQVTGLKFNKTAMPTACVR